MRIAPAITLSEDQREALTQSARSRSVSVRLAQRSQIILLAAAGKQDTEIAEQLAISRQKAGRWRRRFLKQALAGLAKDASRPGCPKRITTAQTLAIVRKTTQERPEHATHWSSRRMAQAARVSEATVRRIWKAHGLKPHLVKSFKLSNDKAFAEKLTDIVGLYLSPPEHALVLCCDEKSQIQALDRTQPGLPLKRGRAGTRTHDYVRHGTTTLFAALNAADGKVLSTCQHRHRHQEWLKFLRLIDRKTPPDKTVHLIMDNYGTHKHPQVTAWQRRHPRFVFHFTPTSASWLNMVERFFRDLTEHRIRRGSFEHLPALRQAIEGYVAQHNAKPKPFIWTAKASDILEKVKRAHTMLDSLRSA